MMELFTEGRIINQLSLYFDVARYVMIPNVSWGFFRTREADLLRITKSKYVYEYEIKTNWADYKRDFEKAHTINKNHPDNYLNDKRIKSKSYVMPLPVFERHEQEIERKIRSWAGLYLIQKLQGNSGYFISQKWGEKPKTDARALTDKEYIKLLRLGTLRFWNEYHNRYRK